MISYDMIRYDNIKFRWVMICWVMNFFDIFFTLFPGCQEFIWGPSRRSKYTLIIFYKKTKLSIYSRFFWFVCFSPFFILYILFAPMHRYLDLSFFKNRLSYNYITYFHHIGASCPLETVRGCSSTVEALLKALLKHRRSIIEALLKPASVLQVWRRRS